jgi:hypothetical protein
MKPVESILEADPRYTTMVCVNEHTGEVRPVHIGDLDSLVRPLELSPEVPENIRLQFEVVRSAFVYSWFAYDLVTLAERHSYAVVEMALRFRAEREAPAPAPDKRTLGPLLDVALRRNWLRREDFEVPAPGRSGTISVLDMMRRFRNNLAHGNMHLFPDGSLEAIRLCAEIISKLFPPVAEREQG